VYAPIQCLISSKRDYTKMTLKINYTSGSSITLTSSAAAAKLGINTSPDGYLKLPAGTSTIPPLLFTSGTLITVGNTESIVDGYMELSGTSNWTAGNSATLSKQTGTPHSGTQCLRVTAATGVADPYTYQANQTVGFSYLTTGWARSDGVSVPKVLDGGGTTLWTGTTSTSWQQFNLSYSAGNSQLQFKAQAAAATNANLVDGDMEAVGTSAWTSSYGSLTKENINLNRYLRVIGNNLYNDACASQNILTVGVRYNITGVYQITQGNDIAKLKNGGVAVWTSPGTESLGFDYTFNVTFTATGTDMTLAGFAPNYGYSANRWDNVVVTTIMPYAEFDDISAMKVNNPVNGALEYDGSKLYFTSSGTRAQLASTSIDADGYAPADWWNGKTCTDWGRTQVVLNNSINAAGGPGQIVGFSNPFGAQIASGTYNAAYKGGILASNGRIYLIPCNQAWQTYWHYIDTDGAIKAYAHGVGAQIQFNGSYGNYDYSAGVLSSNNRVYFIPNDQSYMSYWHYIDTSTGQVVGYLNGVGSQCAVGAYQGGVLAPNNRIYMVPYFQTPQSLWHYINTSDNSVTGYSNTVGAQCVNNAYLGGVLAPNGRIYFTPYFQANQPWWHYINPTTATITGYQHGLGSQCVSQAYSGSVLSSNGRIYMVPFTQSKQSYWHYIDTDGTVKAYSNTVGAQCVNGAYDGGVLAPNGRIYFTPNGQANQPYWHYIDTDGSIKAYSNTSSAVSGAFASGTLSLNGKIYFGHISQGCQLTWYYIDTQSDKPLPVGVCTNPMFNKY
jgi:hypothetical protein